MINDDIRIAIDNIFSELQYVIDNKTDTSNTILLLRDFISFHNEICCEYLNKEYHCGINVTDVLLPRAITQCFRKR